MTASQPVSGVVGHTTTMSSAWFELQGCSQCCAGKSGLDELHVMVRKTSSAQQHITVNERFHQFSSILFSSCIDFERSIQTREVNDRLDQVIRSFLIEISAYLYMKPTKMSPPHKALEWLVYRLYFVTCIDRPSLHHLLLVHNVS